MREALFWVHVHSFIFTAVLQAVPKATHHPDEAGHAAGTG